MTQTRFDLSEANSAFYAKEIRTLKTGREKTEHYYRFRDVNSRDKWVEIRQAELKASEARAEERKKAAEVEKAKIKADFVNPFKKDDLFYSSWGYDQTNIDFYQVVKVGPHSVTVREIYGQDCSKPDSGFSAMSGHTKAVPGAFVKDAKDSTHPVRAYINQAGELAYGIPFGRHSLSPTTADKEHYYSWYA